jgi:NADH dehydrogenase FAD-containing subunit
MDDSLPNIYACGDVADTSVPNPNARSAVHQAEVVVDNLLLALRGKQARIKYTPQWADGVIKLTLGLVRQHPQTPLTIDTPLLNARSNI